MKTFHIKTLGCKVNQVDSQDLREKFFRLGWRENADEAGADVCIVNTCCVTDQADRKSRYALRQALKARANARVAVTGCYAGYHRAVLEKTPGVSAVFDNEEKSAIARWASEEGSRVRSCEEDSPVRAAKNGASSEIRTRAFLKIQDGCDYRCSYCVIPFVRGASRSRGPEEIFREACRLAGAGYQEVVLTGVCLGAYGRDLTGHPDIVDVIAGLEKIDGIVRIRLSSIEASDISERLLEKMSASAKLCPHLHIPFQSGDDEILRDMNKRMRSADYLRLVRRARGAIPRLAVTCDVIVGFPTEEERHFRNTMDFLQAVRPLKAHIFSYSTRKGTAISGMGKKVPDAVVRARYQALVECCDRLSADCRGDFIGTEARVLFESKKDGFWWGYSENYIKAGVRDDRTSLRGSLRRVRLKAIAREYVLGELI